MIHSIMTKHRAYWLLLAGILFTLCFGKLAFFTDRRLFFELILSFGGAFLGYLILLRLDVPLKTLLFFAFGARLLFFFTIPALSDDYFRFIWDGTLSLNGINPFLQLPSFYMEEGAPVVQGISSKLFDELNSPNYFTIYPPVNQLTFAIGALAPTGNYLLSVILMRSVILLGEVITVIYAIKICKHLGIETRHSMIYALNPLIIVELTGNLHFEALMIAFLAVAIYHFLKGHYDWSAVFFALSVNSKLLPLMLLPLLFPRLGFKQSIRYYIIVGGITVLLFSPFLSIEMLEHLSNSVNLYFRSFEFNASIYYVIRWIGFQFTGYNMIRFVGPSLSILVVISILVMTFRPNYHRTSLPKLMCWAFTLYLLGATVVHPWYISTLVFFAVMLPYRFPLYWSGLALLSYAAYQTSAYTENYWLIALEYVMVVGIMCWEVWGKNKVEGSGKKKP